VSCVSAPILTALVLLAWAIAIVIAHAWPAY